MSTRQTLYDEIGGKPAVAAVVDDFYERILSDAHLREFFEGKDMDGLKRHQRALVTVALGGASDIYRGRMMAPAHAGLGIHNDAFDRVLDHLAGALAAKQVRPVTIEKVLAILDALRGDVVQVQPAGRL